MEHAEIGFPNLFSGCAKNGLLSQKMAACPEPPLLSSDPTDE
jgi:hypothetical protein